MMNRDQVIITATQQLSNSNNLTTQQIRNFNNLATQQF